MTHLVVNGWTIFAHPIFLEQVEQLIKKVERLRVTDPSAYKRKNPTKRLAAIAKLAFDAIPNDPTRAEYQQGSTLGGEYRHWSRAKFFQQYRLFFRYHRASKLIVYAWVNDDKTKRAYESRNDAYRVFRAMLDRGRPPDDWEELIREARRASGRLQQLTSKTHSEL